MKITYKIPTIAIYNRDDLEEFEALASSSSSSSSGGTCSTKITNGCIVQICFCVSKK